jgi:hypothetical protein
VEGFAGGGGLDWRRQCLEAAMAGGDDVLSGRLLEVEGSWRWTVVWGWMVVGGGRLF